MSTTSRDRLVAAAFELFEGQGYGATTIDEIAARDSQFAPPPQFKRTNPG